MIRVHTLVLCAKVLVTLTLLYYIAKSREFCAPIDMKNHPQLRNIFNNVESQALRHEAAAHTRHKRDVEQETIRELPHDENVGFFRRLWLNTKRQETTSSKPTTTAQAAKVAPTTSHVVNGTGEKTATAHISLKNVIKDQKNSNDMNETELIPSDDNSTISNLTDYLTGSSKFEKKTIIADGMTEATNNTEVVENAGNKTDITITEPSNVAVNETDIEILPAKKKQLGELVEIPRNGTEDVQDEEEEEEIVESTFVPPLVHKDTKITVPKEAPYYIRFDVCIKFDIRDMFFSNATGGNMKGMAVVFVLLALLIPIGFFVTKTLSGRLYEKSNRVVELLPHFLIASAYLSCFIYVLILRSTWSTSWPEQHFVPEFPCDWSFVQYACLILAIASIAESFMRRTMFSRLFIEKSIGEYEVVTHSENIYQPTTIECRGGL